MISSGTCKVKMLDDNWTAVTADGELAAQFEHTVVITGEGVEILTNRD
jgi:methionyl aminopeptidase